MGSFLFGKPERKKSIAQFALHCGTLSRVLPGALPQTGPGIKWEPRQRLPTFFAIPLNSQFLYKPLC
jgi:hypothetical protein